MRRRALGALVVFAKVPRPGRVKTRLTPPLSREEAADFYRCMLADVLVETSRMCVTHDLEGVVALDPVDDWAEIAPLLPEGLRVVGQRGADLSQRMASAAAETAAGGHSRILLRGSDTPLLGSGVVGQALAALDHSDVALSPDGGGGYGLVALRRFRSSLFDHPMSTENVLADTRSNAHALGLTSVIVGGSNDVDTARDLRLLVDEGEHARARALAPRTFDFIDRNALATREGVADGPESG